MEFITQSFIIYIANTIRVYIEAPFSTGNKPKALTNYYIFPRHEHKYSLYRPSANTKKRDYVPKPYTSHMWMVNVIRLHNFRGIVYGSSRK